MQKLLVNVWSLAAIWRLLPLGSLGSTVDPECTFESCPVCLSEGMTMKSENLNIVIDEKSHSLPLRIGRSTEYWDTQALLAQFTGILAKEKLGINVEYIHADDEAQLFRALSNCRDWEADGTCQQVLGPASKCCAASRCRCPTSEDAYAAKNAGAKHYADMAPDIMWAPEFIETSFCGLSSCKEDDFLLFDINWQGRQTVVTGSAGFVSLNLIYVYPEAAAKARADGIQLGYWEAFTSNVSKYFDTVQMIIDSGHKRVVHEYDGCMATAGAPTEVSDGMNALTSWNWTCEAGGWWLTPACAALGSRWKTECIPLIDDSWGFFKPFLFKGIADNGMRFAKFVAGYDPSYDLIYHKAFNVPFTWWTTDSMYLVHKPIVVAMPQSVMNKQFGKIINMAWKPVLESNKRLEHLLQHVQISNVQVDELMGMVAVAQAKDCDNCRSGKETGPAFYQKIACDYLRKHRDVWSTTWLPDARSCSMGNIYNESTSTCEPCPVGTYGHRSGYTGLTQCLDCYPGTVRQSPGGYTCETCLPGTFAAVTGQSQCRLCPEGQYNDESGATECKSCVDILFGGISPQGAASDDKCTCPTGKYRGKVHGQIDACKGCTLGMLCEEPGLTAPLQAVGFYINVVASQGVTAEYHGYRCRNNDECPSGALGGCAKGRDPAGTACGNCLPNHFVADQGECHECDGVDYLPLLATIFLMLSSMVPLYFYVSADLSRQRMTKVTSFLTLGQLASSLQTLAVFGEMDIVFEEPIRSMLRLSKFFTFELHTIKIQCMFPADDPVTNFLVTLMILPIFMCIIGVMFLLVKIFKNPKLDRNQYFNCVGLLNLICMIAITLTVVRPLNCLRNPNGTSSMSTNPAVVCWQSAQHTTLAVLGIIGMLVYPVAFLATITLITFRYPHLVASGRGMQVLVRYRFLFSRFSPACYYWGVVYMVRSFLISIIPAIFSQHVVMQLMFIDVILITALIGTSRLLPWKTTTANYAEIVIMSFLELFAIVATFFVEIGEQGARQLVTGVLTVCFVGIVLVGSGIIVYCSGRRFLPHKKFVIFLCHFKEAAGCLARLIKTTIQEETPTEVFLDSDQLENINLIFEIVRTVVQNLVVLETRMVLMRPWCAGEITTAIANSVNIVQVKCNDFEPPDDRFLSALNDVWSAEQKQLLAFYHIDITHIGNAYGKLAALPFITLDRTAPMREQMCCFSSIGQQCQLAKSLGSRLSSLSSTSGQMGYNSSLRTGARIIIAGCQGDMEANCLCEVMRGLIRKNTLAMTVIATSAEDIRDDCETADYFIAVLTKGLLQDLTFGEIVVELKTRQEQPIIMRPVLADTTFEFPGAEWYVRLARHRADFSEGVKKLLKDIAPPFSPHGSLNLMRSQISEVCKRLLLVHEAAKVYAISKDGEGGRWASFSIEKNNTDGSHSSEGAKGSPFGSQGSFEESRKSSKSVLASVHNALTNLTGSVSVTSNKGGRSEPVARRVSDVSAEITGSTPIGSLGTIDFISPMPSEPDDRSPVAPQQQ
jgi:hypothetical protein